MTVDPLIRALQSSCDFCKIDNIGEYERKWLAKEISTSSILQALKIHSRQAWYNHMKYHVVGDAKLALADSAIELANTAVDKLEECIEIFDNLKQKAQSLENILANGADPATIRAYISLMAEIRAWLELLAKLEGTFKESSQIRAKTVNVQINNMMGDMLENLCNNCKLKFADKYSQPAKGVLNLANTSSS